ncbi:DNA gyrase subunit B [Deinococcus radiotolerans]|uniref:DNA topoisomerase (ATP-hydrolyzing) n=1 Tax=Deinococcus radiotolerans TaxID=1309407 RepID=A0ABQ2FK09_9DEIO|nr:DNA gyrase subunit B [Deinococcus radiotolerans]GGL05588.1 DNA topoisomerase (ATP-hydrolyzing) [Deinococcus radiotolerans]
MTQTDESTVQDITTTTGPSAEYTAADISVLEGMDAVRKRPGMYVQGGTGVDGYHQLLTEIIDNGIDEGLAGFADEIHIILHADGAATVTDNGRGIPIDIMQSKGRPAIEVIFSELHAGGKFGQGAYKVSGGLHGVGSTVVNALSLYLDVTVNKHGHLHNVRFEKGMLVKPLRDEGPTPKDVTWATRVSFHPDPAIFKEFDNQFNYDRIRNRLRELAYLTGLKIVIRDERTELHAGHVKEETFHEKGGVANFARALVTDDSKLLYDQPIVMRGKHSDVEVEVAFIHANTYASDNILTYANMIRTRDGGTPLTGFKTAYTRILNKYAKDKNLIKNGNPVPSGDDLLEGIYCVVSVKLGDPQFESQAKVKLLNSEAQTAVNAVVGEKFAEFLEENPKVGKTIVEKAAEAARAREAARKARDIVRRSNPLENDDLPGKLADCSSQDPSESEMFIVEGISAGGSAKGGRERRFQAILPLRGKILNVEKAELNKILKNAEIRALIAAIGAGVEGTGDRMHFDLSNLRYHKIIIMTDADMDGGHIATLLLTFFYRYMRPIVEAGYLYIAQPPLYRIMVGREKKGTYLYTNEELKEHVARATKEGKKYDIQRFKGLGEMNADQLWDTTMNPETRALKRVEIEDLIVANEVFENLMGSDVAPRKTFIQENARFAEISV